MSRFVRRFTLLSVVWLTFLLIVKTWLAYRERQTGVYGFAILTSEGYAIGLPERVLAVAGVAMYALLLLVPPLIVTWLWNRYSESSA